MRFLLLFSLLFSIISAFADELIIIQSISSSRKSFVIEKGLADNIREGQESLFSTNQISVLARAIEVSRQFSIWQPVAESAICPFKKKEFVTFNNNIDDVWSHVAQLDYQLKMQEKVVKPFGTIYSHAFLLRAALSRTLSESISETEANKALSRSGQQFELFFYKQLFTRAEWGVGLRYDKETSEIQNPSLTVPTQRYYLMGEFTYHFPIFERYKNNIYASLGFGIGQSQTQIDQAISSGISTVIPVRLGIITPFSGYSLLVELALDTISTKESFASGETQSSNLFNAKLGVGVKF